MHVAAEPVEEQSRDRARRRLDGGRRRVRPRGLHHVEEVDERLAGALLAAAEAGVGAPHGEVGDQRVEHPGRQLLDPGGGRPCRIRRDELGDGRARRRAAEVCRVLVDPPGKSRAAREELQERVEVADGAGVFQSERAGGEVDVVGVHFIHARRPGSIIAAPRAAAPASRGRARCRALRARRACKAAPSPRR